MLTAMLAIVVFSRVVEGLPPPKGPSQTKLCIENGTSELAGAWIWYGVTMVSSVTVEPTRVKCMNVAGYSQFVKVLVGRGERDAPGVTNLFPDPVPGKARSECLSGIEGGQLRYLISKRGDQYQCEMPK